MADSVESTKNEAASLTARGFATAVACLDHRFNESRISRSSTSSAGGAAISTAGLRMRL
jgi:hypothetical protein